jgi:hypothetical protein
LAVGVTLASLAVALVIWRWTQRAGRATDKLISEIGVVAENANSSAAAANEAAAKAAAAADAARGASEAAHQAAEAASDAAEGAEDASLASYRAAEAGRVASEKAKKQIADLQTDLVIAAEKAAKTSALESPPPVGPEPEDLAVPTEDALDPLAVDLPGDEFVKLFAKEQLPLRVVAALVRDWEMKGATGRYAISEIDACARSLDEGPHPWYVHLARSDTWLRVSFTGNRVADSVVRQLAETRGAPAA